MEGRNDRLGDRQPSNQLLDTLAHLGCGFVRERHRQNRLRHGSDVLDQMRNSIGDDASLPATSASQDEHRPIDSFDGFTLLRVELCEKGQ